jgi:hypothetical protein
MGLQPRQRQLCSFWTRKGICDTNSLYNAMRKTAIAEQFGMTFWHENGNQLPSHNLRTVVVDANGKVQSIVAGNKWLVDDLVKGVLKAAAAKDEDSGN